MATCTRREFVAAGAACVGGLLIQRTVVLAQDVSGKVDVGPMADFKEDGAVDTWAGKHRFFVVRQKDRLFAVSAVCTHRGTLVEAQKDQGRLFCPKHKGVYELNGKVREGKPPAALPHLGIALDDRKHVIVDVAKEFVEKDWEAEGAYLKVG